MSWLTYELMISVAAPNIAGQPRRLIKASQSAQKITIKSQLRKWLELLYGRWVEGVTGFNLTPESRLWRVSVMVQRTTNVWCSWPRRKALSSSLICTRWTAVSILNPLIATLKPQSSGPSYSNTPIGTLAVGGWAVTFGTARRGLGGTAARPVPSSLYRM